MMALRNLDIYAISSDVFGYCPENNSLSQEISTLSKGYGMRNHYIYDDACDRGIAIRSARTGRVIYFYLCSVERDLEGDILSWSYKPISEHIRKGWVPENLKIVVFND